MIIDLINKIRHIIVWSVKNEITIDDIFNHLDKIEKIINKEKI